MNTFTRAAGIIIAFACFPSLAGAQSTITPNPGGTGGGGGGSVTGGACAANQVAISNNSQAVPGCATITSDYVNNTIALTGVDINTSNQVKSLHMTAAVPSSQGGTGFGTYTVGDVLYAASTTTLGKLVSVAVGNVLHAGGVAAIPTWGGVSLTADVSGILPTANGGTNNAFTTFSGPATSAKTFTLPNASSTILTSNAAVTVGQGGTGGTNYTAHGVIVGNGTSAMAATGTGTSGQVLTSNGSGSDPTFQTITGTGTVTSIATSSPLGGGTITGSGTLTCATCTTSAAAMTAHGVAVGGGSQTLVATTAGTSGQILTSNGASADPTFQAPGSVLTETALTTSQTLSGYGASYEVTASSDITLTLPTPVGQAGKTIAISVSYNSTGLVTLSSSNIDGQTTRVLHNGESANMTVDTSGTYWHKLSGNTIALRCVIYNMASQAIPATTETEVNLDTIDTDSGGMANVGTHACVVKRPGVYDLRGQTGWLQVGSMQLLGYVGLNVCNVANRTAQAEQANSNTDNGGTYWKMSYTTIKTLATNDALKGCALNTAPATLQALFTNISILELPGW